MQKKNWHFPKIKKFKIAKSKISNFSKNEISRSPGKGLPQFFHGCLVLGKAFTNTPDDP